MKSIQLRAFCPILIMIISVFSWVFTADCEGVNISFGGGSGTPIDPYVIENVWDLQNISMDLNAHYILKNDIDASVMRSWNSGKGFTPIGNYSEPFKGTLDGSNYTISGFFINRTTESDIGLFGYIDAEGIVKNLKLKNIEISGNGWIGGFTGSNGGTISSCYANGEITGAGNGIGGFVGCNYGTLSNCRMNGKVSGNENVGGLVGRLQQGLISNCNATINVTGDQEVGGLVGWGIEKVTGCHLTGNVTGNGNYTGGLIGFLHLGIVSYCHARVNVSGEGQNTGGLIGLAWSSSVSNCYSIGYISGNRSVGGLLGSENYGVVSDCFAFSNVSGNRSVGGLVGGNGGTVFNCHTDGNIIGEENVGGLIGRNDGTVSYSYSNGEVRGNVSVGGLIGSTVLRKVSNCYVERLTTSFTFSF